jgi:hypothetical protein
VVADWQAARNTTDRMIRVVEKDNLIHETWVEELRGT